MKKCAAMFVALALCLFAGECLAQTIVLENLILDNQAGRIMVRFGMHVDDMEVVAEELKDGTSLGLVGFAELRRSRTLWWDSVVGSAEFVSVLGYDQLSREFLLQAPGMEKPSRGKSMAELTKRHWERLSLDLGRWTELDRGEDYVLDFEVRMSQLEVPAWLKGALFFWPWDVIEPTTYRLDFNY